MIPYVLPHDDQVHFWWFHECKDFRDGVKERQTMLPVTPLDRESAQVAGWSYDRVTDTVSPSILCTTCGTHGFWENGSWRRAA